MKRGSPIKRPYAHGSKIPTRRYDLAIIWGLHPPRVCTGEAVAGTKDKSGHKLFPSIRIVPKEYLRMLWLRGLSRHSWRCDQYRSSHGVFKSHRQAYSHEKDEAWSTQSWVHTDGNQSSTYTVLCESPRVMAGCRSAADRIIAGKYLLRKVDVQAYEYDGTALVLIPPAVTMLAAIVSWQNLLNNTSPDWNILEYAGERDHAPEIPVAQD